MTNWTPRNKRQWNLNQNLYNFIQENAFENVIRKLAASMCLDLNVLRVSEMVNDVERILRGFQHNEWSSGISYNNSLPMGDVEIILEVYF